MTPEEAVGELVAGGYIDDVRSSIVQDIIEDVETTAKTGETRRCAARAKETITAALDEMMGKLVAEDILISGGLEAEE